jgi:hypothetical protein
LENWNSLVHQQENINVQIQEEREHSLFPLPFCSVWTVSGLAGVGQIDEEVFFIQSTNRSESSSRNTLIDTLRKNVLSAV